MIELRENQVEPVRVGIEFFKKEKAEPSIIVAPTAFGKSIVIAKIAEGTNDKLLILQPSKELLEQNYNKYLLLGGKAEIYSASFNRKKIADVTYATIGSIKSIGSLFKELGFTKMIIDEAHLYPRNSDSMLGGFLLTSGITHVLGLTATPLKLQTNSDLNGNAFSKLVMLTSRSKHGNFFKEIIHVSQIQEIVEMGFWSKLIYEVVDIDDSALQFNTSKSEFTEESIRYVYEKNNLKELILKKLNENIDRRSVLVFVPTVAEAILLATEIPESAAVYGDMDKKERGVVIKLFKEKKIRTIFNVNVLSVGFDHPELDMIICARATASLAWFYQALGRLTRIAANKVNGLVIDISGNVKRFGRIEKLYFKKERIWKLFGESGKLLTGIGMHEIGSHFEKQEGAPVKFTFGKHKGKDVRSVDKGYLEWMYKTFTEGKSWNEYNEEIKKEIELVLNLQPA